MYTTLGLSTLTVDLMPRYQHHYLVERTHFNLGYSLEPYTNSATHFVLSYISTKSQQGQDGILSEHILTYQISHLIGQDNRYEQTRS